MALKPIPRATTLRLKAEAKATGTKIRLGKAIEPSRRTEVQYRKELYALVNQMAEDVRRDIFPLLNRFEKDYVADVSFTGIIAAAIETLTFRYRQIVSVFAPVTATDMVDSEYVENTKRYGKGIPDDQPTPTVPTNRMEPTIEASVAENVSLIKSIPEEYFKDITSIVMQSVNQGEAAGSIEQKLQDRVGVTRRRAKLIARDQVAKVSAAINQRRQMELGVTEYVWITSQDSRVRPTHKANHGKVFRWDSPPAKTGPPGHDVNCRCVARAVIPTF